MSPLDELNYEKQSQERKMGRWDGPLHIRCPNDSKNRTSVEDQRMIAELRLYKK